MSNKSVSQNSVVTTCIDICYFLAVTYIISKDWVYLISNQYLLVAIIIFCIGNICLAIKYINLDSSVMSDRSELISLCSNDDLFTSYNFFKYLMGYGTIAYLMFSLGGTYICYSIVIFVLTKFISMGCLTFKNNKIFKRVNVVDNK